jgi:hypothetical protein
MADHVPATLGSALAVGLGVGDGEEEEDAVGAVASGDDGSTDPAKGDGAASTPLPGPDGAVLPHPLSRGISSRVSAKCRGMVYELRR